MKKRSLWFALAAAVTFGSGVINLASSAGPAASARQALLRGLFPLEFLHLSRFVTVLAGLALIISSVNVYRRKRRAQVFVSVLAAASVLFHLTKGLDYEEALFSFGLLVLLTVLRDRFTVKSAVPDTRRAVLRVGLAAATAIAYGVLGFWALDRRHFGTEFTLLDGLRSTFRVLTFSPDPRLEPLTRFGRWFFDSLVVLSVAALLYGLYALFRPVYFRLRTLPQERERARRIREAHGRSSLDFFKIWPDKSLFFPAAGEAFLAYRVVGRNALVLGDPVGPAEAVPRAAAEFRAECADNDWKPSFYSVLPDYLPAYRELGFRKLKVGDEAIVDLSAFSLQGKSMKHLRHVLNQAEKEGTRAVWIDPPLDDATVRAAGEVSDDWLRIPGRRERGFTQGVFAEDYVRGTPLFAVFAPDGRMRAFVNLIPSYAPGEATIDLMRHRSDAPAGTMDVLFAGLISRLSEKGWKRFNLGLAPMSGFREHEESTPEERAVHAFLGRLDFLFSYSGLYQFKAKFATSWEPRYLAYLNVLDLPGIGIALGRAAAVHRRGALPVPFPEE